MTESLEDMVARIRARSLPTVLERLAVVVDALATVALGASVSTEEIREAHTLAGTLGSYGRPGSELLREVEIVLKEADAETAMVLVEEVRRLSDQLELAG